MPAQDLAEICNFRRISETLGTAGQPLPDQFAAIRAAGYEVVVNLAMPTSTNALANEAELVAEQGMAYVHIPVVWEQPTEDDLAQFFATMEAYRGRPVFVHCALNMRVSVFVLLYRVLRLGVPLEVAQVDLLSIWDPDGVWAQFMDDALARNREMAG
jgi:protein tyrosine phosphatase (PTP) superfamily phosphohydrolase (DUF442 family)